MQNNQSEICKMIIQDKCYDKEKILNNTTFATFSLIFSYEGMIKITCIKVLSLSRTTLCIMSWPKASHTT